MKKTLVLLFVIISLLQLKAQSFNVISSEEAQTIKNSKVIVVIPDEATKEVFQKAVNDIWTYSEISEFQIGDETSYKSEDESKIYLKLRKEESHSMKHYTHSIGNTDYYFKTVTTGYLMAFSYGGSKKAFIKTYVPVDGETEELSEEVIYFGLSALQTQINYVNESGAKNSMKYGGYLKEQGPALKDKTLFVLSSMLDVNNKNSEADILSGYSGKIKGTDYATWKEIIVSKDKGSAYLMPVPFPIGGNYMFQYWVVDAATGKVLGVQQKAVSASKKLAPEITNKTMAGINDILLGN